MSTRMLFSLFCPEVHSEPLFFLPQKLSFSNTLTFIIPVTVSVIAHFECWYHSLSHGSVLVINLNCKHKTMIHSAAHEAAQKLLCAWLQVAYMNWDKIK